MTSMYRGDSKVLGFTVTDDAGDPVDLTGATIKWALAKSAGATPVLSRSIGSGIAIVSAEDGTFDVTLEPANTATLRAMTYYHEAEVTISGVVTTLTLDDAALTLMPETIPPP